jgi:glycosyltransferase involved in cell wall biosynthesis
MYLAPLARSLPPAQHFYCIVTLYFTGLLMQLISVVTPCYNEEENVEELYKQIKAQFANLKNYRYEHIFIDNASVDNTVSILKLLAANDPNVKVIVNARNFGHIRSPFYAMLQAQGAAVVLLASDLQDPPQLIAEFIKHWEAGFKVVVGVKPSSKENFPMAAIRRAYYNFITRIADIRLIKNFTGFGLYDQEVMKLLRKIDDAYPYFRGLISELGFPVAQIPFEQPARVRGITKNNFYSLYDMAILGITNHSKLPIRIATLGGFFFAVLSLLAAVVFLILKLALWNHFPVGVAPILIGMFFLAAMQLFFIGILGEYVLSIHTQTLKRPLVVESERINF